MKKHIDIEIPQSGGIQAKQTETVVTQCPHCKSNIRVTVTAINPDNDEWVEAYDEHADFDDC